MSTAVSRVQSLLEAGEAISEADARALYQSTDLLGLGSLTQLVREGHTVSDCSLVCARRIRYSNVCRNRCPYCNKARRPEDPDAYTRSISEVVDLASEALAEGIDQIQLAGGASPDADVEYFIAMISELRRHCPDAHIQGFAPAQLVNISVLEHQTFRETLMQLRKAGLDSLLEDGADIFDPEIRRVLCSTKATGGQWLQVMREAHELGMVGGASMLYGHYEGGEERVQHLSYLRDLQSETRGFTFYAPRTFRGENNLLSGTIVGGAEDMREFAVGRLFLHNFPHLRCYANDLGMKTTQLSLYFGVDSVAVILHDGEPIRDEDRAARGMPNAAQLRELIERAGFTVRADSLDQRPLAVEADSTTGS
jgi:aminodeoxyfutalosine synthase